MIKISFPLKFIFESGGAAYPEVGYPSGEAFSYTLDEINRFLPPLTEEESKNEAFRKDKRTIANDLSRTHWKIKNQTYFNKFNDQQELVAYRLFKDNLRETTFIPFDPELTEDERKALITFSCTNGVRENIMPGAALQGGVVRSAKQLLESWNMEWSSFNDPNKGMRENTVEVERISNAIHLTHTGYSSDNKITYQYHFQVSQSNDRFLIQPDPAHDEFNIDEHEWKHILSKAHRLLREKKNKQEALDAKTLFQLIPCLNDEKFTRAFAKHIAHETPPTIADTEHLIGLCFATNSDAHQNILEIFSVEQKDLERFYFAHKVSLNLAFEKYQNYLAKNIQHELKNIRKNLVTHDPGHIQALDNFLKQKAEIVIPNQVATLRQLLNDVIFVPSIPHRDSAQLSLLIDKLDRARELAAANSLLSLDRPSRDIILTFNEGFSKHKDLFIRNADPIELKILKAIGHILATALTGGLYAGARAASSYYRNGTMQFWKSHDEKLALTVQHEAEKSYYPKVSAPW
jgi:hypothetical protein